MNNKSINADLSTQSISTSSITDTESVWNDIQAKLGSVGVGMPEKFGMIKQSSRIVELGDALRAHSKSTNSDSKPSNESSNSSGISESNVQDIQVESFQWKHQLECCLKLISKVQSTSIHAAVLWGNKNMGKSQCLHALFVILKHLGEKVIIIDQTVSLPPTNSKFCGNLWIEDFSKMVGLPAEAAEWLEKFKLLDGNIAERLAAFSTFKLKLASGLCNQDIAKHIWILIDEVTSLNENGVIKYCLPEEQLQ